MAAVEQAVSLAGLLFGISVIAPNVFAFLGGK
jgi:hypothetical protein